MKLKLNNHSDWDMWLAGLREVIQDYALVPPPWICGYECLLSEHKIRPPPWIRAWVETRVTMDNMTKEELNVWKLVKSRPAEDQAQLNVANEQDEASVNAAAAAATLAKSRRRVCKFESKPGTCVIRIGIRLKTGIQNKITFENPSTMTVSALPNMRRKDCPGKVIFDGDL